MSGIEAWLDGPVVGVPPLLMPVAHALIQARRDVEQAAVDLTADELWARPGGAGQAQRHSGRIIATAGIRRGLSR